MIQVHNTIQRETAVRDPHTHQPIIVKMDPPGYQIGVRLKHKRDTYYINVLDLYHLATHQVHEPEIKPTPPVLTPKTVAKKEVNLPDEVIDILMNHGKLHFSQIRHILKTEKHIDLSKHLLGALLKLMAGAKQIDAESHGYYK